MTRKAYSTPEGQAAANQRWIEKNKEHRRYLSARGAARSFIRNRATIEDLQELRKLIDDKEKELKK